MTQNKSVTSAQISKNLLRWYDQHSRDLPWRVPPADRQSGVLPDPYHVWLSEIMLQQTTVVTVGPYFQAVLSRWPDVAALAAANDADVMAEWAGLGYYARARNLLKSARVVAAEFGGVFPDDEPTLLGLPGIGPYTAAAISTIAFDRKATVMDGNIERVMARLFEITAPLPDCKPTLYKLAETATPDNRVGDYVQAVMDLGATVCTPRNPKCDLCPLNDLCLAKQLGVAETLPAKRPKKPKPTRNGYVYFAYTSSGQILLETRPDKGLLGGMLGLPSSDWVEGAASPAPPMDSHWRMISPPITHVFTHFKLSLTLVIGQIDNANLPKGMFLATPSPESLPTIMRKAFIMALKNV